MAAPMKVPDACKRNHVCWIVLGVLLALALTLAEETDRTGESTSNQHHDDVVLESVFGSMVRKPGDSSVRQGQSHNAESDRKAASSESDTESKLFSLTSMIKSFLSPVIEEFQVSAEEADEKARVKEETKVEEPEVEIAENVTEVFENVTETLSVNATANNDTDSSKKFKFQCIGRNVTENTTLEVRLVNSSTLLEVLSFDKNRTSGDCVLVMFYAPWCQFCAKTAPHYNALARAFPQLEVLAVDAVHFSNLNARFGTVAVPNVMLFHQSRSAVRFNHTERVFHSFIQFIKNVTGLEPNTTVNVTDNDYFGPLSSVPTQDPDYLLWVAWVFVITCSSYMFIQSQYGQQAINRVRILWQEHQHIE